MNEFHFVCFVLFLFYKQRALKNDVQSPVTQPGSHRTRVGNWGLVFPSTLFHYTITSQVCVNFNASEKEALERLRTMLLVLDFSKPDLKPQSFQGILMRPLHSELAGPPGDL